MMSNRTSYWVIFVLLINWFAPARAEVALPDFSSLAEKYSPAVVNISTTQKVTAFDGANQLINRTKMTQ